MAEIARNIRSSFHVCVQFFAQLNTPFSASSFQIFGAISSFISRHVNASVATLRGFIFYLIRITASSFQIFRSFSSFISRNFNASIATLRSSIFYFIRMQFVNSFNKITASTILVLMGFAQLKFQGNGQSLFATHPRATLVAVSSLIVYFVANTVLPRFPLRHFNVVANYCSMLSGYASVASLASVLLPDSVSRYVYAIFALLPACELLYSLYQKLVAEEDDAEFRAYGRRFCRFLNNMFRFEGNSYYRRGCRGFLNNIFRVEGDSSGQWLPPL